MKTGSIAPVDMAQATIGPGMAIYSRYSAVRHADGNWYVRARGAVRKSTGRWMRCLEERCRLPGLARRVSPLTGSRSTASQKRDFGGANTMAQGEEYQLSTASS